MLLPADALAHWYSTIAPAHQHTPSFIWATFFAFGTMYVATGILLSMYEGRRRPGIGRTRSRCPDMPGVLQERLVRRMRERDRFRTPAPGMENVTSRS